MYKLFFESKIITFTDNYAPQGDDIATLEQADGFQIAKVLQKVGNRNSLEIISPSPSEVFKTFCSNFRTVQAAGGALQSNGALMMIYRNGRWDLPKGHMEAGESPEQSALREVSEECGIEQIALGEYITSTRHIYPLGSEWILKITHWYSMSCPKQCSTTPQTEEGIERAEWVPWEDVQQRLTQSYSTIVEVINRLKKDKK